MLGHDQRQALLTEEFWTTLQGDRAASPPERLDPDVAETLVSLRAEAARLRPNATIIDMQRRRLVAQLKPPVDKRHTWSGPAVDPARLRRARAERRHEPDDAPLLTSAATTQPESMPTPRRLPGRDALKLAAAITLFVIVGLVLALVQRDTGHSDETIPGAAPTVEVTQSSNVSPLKQTVTAVWAQATAQAAAAPETDWSAVGAAGISIAVGGKPHFVAYGAGAIWVSWIADNGLGHVSRVDPETNRVVATLDTGGGEIDAADDVVLVLAWNARSVDLIDPVSNQVVGSLQAPAGFHPNLLAITDSGIWVVDNFNNRVLRFDRSTGALLATIEVSSPCDVAVIDDQVFVSTCVFVETTSPVSADRVVVIDASTNGVTGIIRAASNGYVESIDGDVLVSDRTTGSITKIDPATLTVTGTIAITKPDGATSIDAYRFVAADGSLWITDTSEGWLYRVDPATGRVQGSAQIALEHPSLVYGAGSIWIPDPVHGSVVRLTNVP